VFVAATLFLVMFENIFVLQERIIFDTRTQMNADNQDFKYKAIDGGDY
jgi:hypothetical protein